MRLQTTIDRLTQQQWEFAQNALQVEYDIPMEASRVCLVVEHRGEERHVELPLASFVSLLVGIAVNDTARTVATALAALTPDALPDHLETVRNEADPARRPVVSEEDAERDREVQKVVDRHSNYDPVLTDRLENGAYDK